MTGSRPDPSGSGPRTNSSRTQGDYDLVVYRKGAWVLHMLRNYLLRDDDPGGDAISRACCATSTGRFAGQPAFTEDFRAAVERATGEDMGWFFAQWVYGTDVPTYRFRWTCNPRKAARWRVHGRVEQTNVPASFGMPVALRVTYPDGTFARERVWVRGPLTEFDLPLSPKRPTNVMFNDLESVLCEIAK